MPMIIDENSFNVYFMINNVCILYLIQELSNIECIMMYVLLFI